MLTILDVCMVAHFGFAAHIPWWLWAWGILNEVVTGSLQENVRKAAKVIIDERVNRCD